jgi:hypothetical protein
VEREWRRGKDGRLSLSKLKECARSEGEGQEEEERGARLVRNGEEEIRKHLPPCESRRSRPAPACGKGDLFVLMRAENATGYSAKIALRRRDGVR